MTMTPMLSVYAAVLFTGVVLAAPAQAAHHYDGEANYTSFGFRIGERVSDASFKDVDGVPGTLAALAGTQGAVIAIRDAECPVSQRYAPRLAELEREYGTKGFKFAYIDVAPQDARRARADAAGYGLRGRIIQDSGKKLVGALRATSSAEVFVIDARGTLRYRGAVDDQYGISVHKDAPHENWLRDALNHVLAGENIAQESTPAPGCLFDTDMDAAGKPRAVTYDNRISRILERKCVACHRTDGLGPMPLQTYAQVFQRRAIIDYMTSNRLMPPWKADPHVGTWENDASLSKADLADLHAWLTNGAPEGKKSEAPIAHVYNPGWRMEKPDAILQIPDKFTIPAQGVVRYKFAYVKTNFDTDKWISEIEIHPTAPRVVHHALVFLEEPGRKYPNDPAYKPGDPLPEDGTDSFFAATALGAPITVFPKGAAKKLPKGAWLKFQIHYQPNGSEQTDQTQIAFKFADDAGNAGDKLAEVDSRSAYTLQFAIPPGDPHYQIKAKYKFQQPGELISLFPHSHLRGNVWKMELEDKDGQLTPLLDVPHYDFNWQGTYRFKTPVHVEPGMALVATAWYDNSANNPNNPDPKKTVHFGEQTYDEMMFGFFDWIPEKK